MKVAIIENEKIISTNIYPETTDISEIENHFDKNFLLVEVESNFDPTNKKYINGEFVAYDKKESISEQELFNAEILLNQATILENQALQDSVLAEILLNQVEV